MDNVKKLEVAKAKMVKLEADKKHFENQAMLLNAKTLVLESMISGGYDCMIENQEDLAMFEKIAMREEIKSLKERHQRLENDWFDYKKRLEDTDKAIVRLEKKIQKLQQEV